MKKNRWIIIIAAAVLVVAAIVYGFRPKPVAVDLAKVTRGALRVTIDEEGKTRVKDRFVISSPLAGYLRRIILKVGDPVAKGQTVAILEPVRSAVLDPRSRAEAEAAVSAGEAALNSARENAKAAAANEAYAAAKFERVKQLFAEGYATKDAADLAKSDAERSSAARLAADAAVKTAAAELERFKSALKYSGSRSSGETVSVPSPVSGRVLKVHHESEGSVNTGEPLIDVGDSRGLEVKVEVLSADAVKIKPGTPVIFERWGGDPALTGTVRVIEPAAFTKISSLGVEEQRVFVVADITSVPESWQRLGDGYRVEARFIIWEGANVLQIPASALFRHGDGWAVFAVQDKKARLRPVTIGHRNGLTAEILAGLSENETVVTHPEDTVKDGVTVKQR